MRSYEIEIPFEVIPVQSARFRRFGNHISSYQPAKVINFKKQVAEYVAEDIKHETVPLFSKVPLEVRFRFYFKPPKTLRGNPVYKITRPDIDNCGKALQDALTGILWEDDSLIAVRHSFKMYSDNPRIGITVNCLDKAL